MFKFFKHKMKNSSTDKFVPANDSVDKSISSIDGEFMNVFLQTCNKPLGDPQAAWSWVMERIAYFKKAGVEREKIYALAENVLINLTESYVANFSEFRTVVDDVSPIIIACEKLLDIGDAAKAKVIAEPYIQYVVSIKNDIIGKQICCQNKREAWLLLNEFSELKDMPKTKDNYTYLIVLYCRILDGILCNTKEEMDFRSEQKKELLLIAREISPWNSTVWESMSHIAKSDEEYNKFIEKALKYAIYDGEPYGLGHIYANLAMHYVSRDVNLSQALKVMCKKYNGNSLAVDFLLSKVQAESMDDEKAESVLREAGIQIGYSRLVEEF